MLQSILRTASAVALGLVLAACGGGGGGGSGGGGGGGGSTNLPPLFSSSASVSIAEGTTGAFYTAVAADPNNNPLTFSIDASGDGGRFSINGSSGALSFLAAPDFENPTDANGDNVYQITLRVSDGLLSATLGLSITVTNTAGTLQVRRVATSFDEPLFLTGLTDGSGRVYVVQKEGLILILNPTTGLTESTPFINLSSQVATDGEQGLLGFALAPDFATSRTFYVYLTNTASNIEVRRYQTMAGNLNVGDPSTSDVILTIAHPGATNHNGGWIGFGPDNMLYIATGDGGGTPANAQNVNSLLGKILRIDVRSDAFPPNDNRDYAIPSGNPFATAGGAPEIWVLGLRNPYRAGFDPQTGDLFIGDVGQSAREEIDRVRQNGGGSNFGWPFFEGTLPFQGTPPAGFVHAPPVTEYPRGNTLLDGETVVGGYVYRGSADTLRNHYLFADFIDGHVWSIPETSLVPGTTAPTSQYVSRDAAFPPAGSLNSPSSFGVDAAGNIYLLDFDGDIFRFDAVE